MSRRSRLIVIGVLALAVIARVPAGLVGCAPEQSACTAESTGHGGQRALVRRDLPGLPDKAGCNPHVEAVTSADDLRRAYEQAGIPISDPDGGASAPSAMALPGVDFTRESVIIREATDTQAVSWLVVSGSTVTVGTQGCVGAATGACVFQAFAVDALVTKAVGYACDDISCGGAAIGRSR
jgi:hypothetical protein